MGPADEFRPLGYDAAKPGGAFVKIGVGMLKRTDEKAYDAFRLYPIADHGKWSVKHKGDSIGLFPPPGFRFFAKQRGVCWWSVTPQSTRVR